MPKRPIWTACLLTGLAAFVGAAPLRADEEPPAKPTIAPDDDLSARQRDLASKYSRLEELLFKLSSVEAATNPRRAALLTRAFQQAKEKLTKQHINDLVDLMQQRQYRKAAEGQAQVQADLAGLLQLLLSEDRSERLKSEQQRIKEYLKEVDKLLRLQKSMQGQTEGGAEAKKLAKQQEDIAKRTGELTEKIQRDEEEASGKTAEKESENRAPGEQKPGEQKPGEQKPGEQKPGEQKPGEQKPGEQKPGEQKPGEQKPGEQKPGEQKPGEQKPGEQKPGEQKPGEQKPGEQKPGEQKPGEQKPGEQKPGEQKPGEQKPGEQKPGEQKPGEQKPGEQKPGEQKPGEPQSGEQKPNEQEQNAQQDQNPAKQRLQQAQEAMKRAQQKLEDAKKRESLEDQADARAELEKAKEELERILRQLREEEQERALTMLEARFRKMLEAQLKILDSTRKLNDLSEPNRGETFFAQAGKLSRDEQKIVLEAQKALTVLQEEQSSAAFPAAVEQMAEDMESVAQRLAEAKVNDITIGLEEDIVSALQEMIAALEREQKEREKKKKEEQENQQNQQQGQPQEQPLVDAIAELKLLKSLQLRVNSRTGRYAKLLKDPADPVGQVEGEELQGALKKLGAKQQEIHQITRDILLEKNK